LNFLLFILKKLLRGLPIGIKNIFPSFINVSWGVAAPTPSSLPKNNYYSFTNLIACYFWNNLFFGSP
ncbi:MAG: hypothetical protein RM368_09605, partial [Nostoc sp. DedSLP03]|uniref:hypothetical protein n=1 Tax=Nostoc sp. DedSLP03 TaxID=3075400 RepID=UPI002AD4208F